MYLILLVNRASLDHSLLLRDHYPLIKDVLSLRMTYLRHFCRNTYCNHAIALTMRTKRTGTSEISSNLMTGKGSLLQLF